MQPEKGQNPRLESGPRICPGGGHKCDAAEKKGGGVLFRPRSPRGSGSVGNAPMQAPLRPLPLVGMPPTTTHSRIRGCSAPAFCALNAMEAALPSRIVQRLGALSIVVNKSQLRECSQQQVLPVAGINDPALLAAACLVLCRQPKLNGRSPGPASCSSVGTQRDAEWSVHGAFWRVST
ncbi:hypothetical protein MTO96_041420, partial [Rhipicephalus appendiculatus]